MKNYIIGILVVIIIVISSMFYKYYRSNTIRTVPFPVETKAVKTEAPKLYIYLFFSRTNCKDCLGVVEILNVLPDSMFFVRGIVPDEELVYSDEIRLMTGAKFPIEGQQKYKPFIPLYTPSMACVGDQRELFFLLPGIPGEKEYLFDFLIAFYHKISPYLNQRMELKR